MRRINNFIFDFDGVIADTESVWFECLVDFAKRHGLPFAEREMEQFIGDGDTKMMDMLAAGLGSRARLDELYPELRNDFRERTRNLGTRPGVIDYLEYARASGISVACASSSRSGYIKSWLSRLNVTAYFSKIVTRDDVASPDLIKPNPDIYLEALSALRASADECVAFEDSAIGIRAAEAAGIFCVSVPNRVSAKSTAGLANMKLDMSAVLPEHFVKMVLHTI